MLDLHIADVINMTSLTAYTPEITASFKPPKGKVFVTLLVGVADKKDPSTFDVVKALNDLGWFQKVPE